MGTGVADFIAILFGNGRTVGQSVSRTDGRATISAAVWRAGVAVLPPFRPSAFPPN